MIELADASIRNRMYTEEEQQKLYKRTLIIVSISQMFGGAGLVAGITVGALLARRNAWDRCICRITGRYVYNGVCGSGFLCWEVIAKIWSPNRTCNRVYSRGLGAIGVVLVALTNSIILLLVSLLIYGAGTATNLQARYAGTDLADKRQRATAISITMVMTTFGAVAGPNLVGVMGDFAHSIGIPNLAGPFILSAAEHLYWRVLSFLLCFVQIH